MFLQLSKSRRMITLSFAPDNPLADEMVEIVKQHDNNPHFIIRPRLDPFRPMEICFDIAMRATAAVLKDMKPILETSLGGCKNIEKIQQIASWDQEMVLTFDFSAALFKTFINNLISTMQKRSSNQSESLENALALLSLRQRTTNEEKKHTSDSEKSKSFIPQYTAKVAETSNDENIKKIGDYLAAKLGSAFIEKNGDKFIWQLVSNAQGTPIAAEFKSPLTEKNKNWFRKRFPNCTFSITDNADSSTPKGIVTIPIPSAILLETRPASPILMQDPAKNTRAAASTSVTEFTEAKKSSADPVKPKVPSLK